ncbi:hypothetical protein J4225_01390 [Candidatus Pacearchaeota archaeon]|nr:hypothetical protein [Candidatus Pacearchaeota archaeon]
MDYITSSIIIIDVILMIGTFVLFILQKKFKIKQKAIDNVWELVKYVTMALVGYQFGKGL